MKTEIITLRTTEEIKKELDNMALEENRSLNNLIETILIKYIEEKKKTLITPKNALYGLFNFPKSLAPFATQSRSPFQRGPHH